MTALALPRIIVPVAHSVAALDACLASLERTLPASAQVLIADHAGNDPLAEGLARRWCDRSRLDAEYRRAEVNLTLSANINQAISGGDRDAVVLQADAVPVNPWMVGGYFLYGLVDKDDVRRANNNLLLRSDELWVFGAPSDGVDVEVGWAEANGLPVRWFDLDHYGEAIVERVGRPS